MKDLSKIKLTPYTSLEFAAGICAGASDDDNEVSVKVYAVDGQMRFTFRREAIDPQMPVSIRRVQ